MDDEILTTQAAAERAGVGPTAIKRWADEGRLPCIRTAGGHRRFRRRDLETFLRGLESPAPAAASGALDEWIGALLATEAGYEVEARLLLSRGRLGAWRKVAAEVGEVLVEIGARWATGAITIVDEHVMSERLTRALAKMAESILVPPSAPLALLTTPEGDDHTLGLACAELCLREDGWRTRWVGRATPAEELVGEIDRGQVDLLAVSASEYSGSGGTLRRWLDRVAPTCAKAGVPIVLGGRGSWPPIAGDVTRVSDFEELHAFLVRLREH